ncbi:MAG: D-2-hydroxyacid dehydrogenase [Spirochaetaceae bacterium]|nr:MAG: D-2-hydroxyacid dehydrogenase [Spirochaetaceae bacterium]
MNIVVLDGYTLNPGDNPWTAVERLGTLTVYDRTPQEQIVERAAGAQIVLTNKTPLSRATIEQLPELRFIAVLATGYNVVDVAYARERGIPVSNVPVYGTDAVAEYVFALTLNFCRAPQTHADLVRAGEWGKTGDFSFWRTPLSELAGKTMGIVGFGRIGRRVGELAAAFKMRVLAHDTYHGNPPAYPFEFCEIDELFAQSDVVSLHCNQTPENTGMVNTRLLQRMKPTALLVNTARGGLVNEADLAAALVAGCPAAAALDVVSVEPITADNPLSKVSNALITPHIAWAAVEARRRLMATTAENIAAFQAGAPIHVVNA